jgi:hypothetical protein
MIDTFGEARSAALEMGGNLVAEVAVRRRAEPDGLCAATHRPDGRPTPGYADVGDFRLGMLMQRSASPFVIGNAVRDA